MTARKRASEKIFSPKKIGAGFTLIELLVVISIIGLLASVVLVALNNARMKSRDTRRLADMTQIQKALEIYYNKYNGYPDVNNYGESELIPSSGGTSPSNCGGWDTSEYDNNNSGNTFIDPLVAESIMSRVPRDPRGTSGWVSGSGDCDGENERNYRYYRYSSGCADRCGSNDKAFYVLGVNIMETLSAHHSPTTNYPGSPGWSCSPRDWSLEFDWVAGQCE